jgi:hypothetical protein
MVFVMFVHVTVTGGASRVLQDWVTATSLEGVKLV